MKKRLNNVDPQFITSPNSSVQHLLILVLLGPLSIACGDLQREVDPPQEEERVTPPLFSGAYVNEACEEDQDCRAGLSCESGQCLPNESTSIDGACLRTDECDEGLRCGWAGFCIEAGEGIIGSPCAQDGECERGTYCDRTGGIAGQCMPFEGEGGDIGATCDEETRCAEGLVCSSDREERICLPGSLLLNPDVFRGVACDEAGEAELEFGMRHALPHQGADFFATPFPSDLRITDGQVDLRDYPRPGAVLNERDLFGGLLDEIQSLRTGWSRNPGIFLRFTRPLSEEVTTDSNELSKHFKLIDLNTGERYAFESKFSVDRNKYICARSVFIHPSWARPLEPGHSYAVVVLRSLRSIDDEPPTRLDDMDMLLKERRPSEGAERRAWQRFSALRQWLKDDELNESDIAGATIFTVEEDRALFTKARDAVYESNIVRFDPANPPVLCQEGVRSPCVIDAESNEANPAYDLLSSSRDCPEAESPLYHEIHAKVRLPIFQRGELPYTKEGGGIRTDDGGKPQLASYESVCLAITIPKGIEAPAEGWPVILYGHGTGGNFRSGVKLMANQLSSLRDKPPEDAEEDERGPLMPVALIEIDQVMHGTRLGPEPLLAPGPLFFNVQNPIAARGNLIQGAVDNFALIRFITQSSDLHDWPFPDIGTVKFDQRRVIYHGHSQGGTTGPLFAPFEDRLSGVIFSGTAGGLMFSLLDKKEPYDATVGLQLVLQEFNLERDHPALHIFQEYFDDVDPINYAAALNKRAVGNPIHSLHLYGRHDSFTPDSGQRSFAAASGATLAIPDSPIESFDLLDDLEVITQSYPIGGNQEIPSVGLFTSVVAQHSPERENSRDLYNGHFVAYRNPVASRQLLYFIRDLSLGRTPLVAE